ncbi:MAG: hypothetical protein KF866_11100 [Phycisphaeraceae bacterium]|nr:hypothetical protein [Phycisphaeraceae bacterium]MCW5754277.1 hypothetical protein [Phycisphaeraceae bacterium]
MDAIAAAGVVLGALVCSGGAWAVYRARSSAKAGLAAYRGVGVVTLMLAGLSGLLVGYHLIAWSLPGRPITLVIPSERMWIVLCVIAAGLTCSIWLDRR